MAENDLRVTRLLQRLEQGAEPGDLEPLLELVYDELRARAVAQLRRERSGHTLQPTALVNEVYLRLQGQNELRFEDRNAFFAFAAGLMRRVLVDHARSRNAAKRGGGQERIPLADGLLKSTPTPIDLLALDDALCRLEELNERYARVVELRYFAGLEVEEVAVAIGVNARTVKRDWQVARTFLYDELAGEDDREPG